MDYVSKKGHKAVDCQGSSEETKDTEENENHNGDQAVNWIG